MGKYAHVKLSIILYHKQTNLSIGFEKVLENFAKVLEKYFFKSLLINEKGKRKPLSRRGNHALIAAFINLFFVYFCNCSTAMIFPYTFNVFSGIISIGAYLVLIDSK